MDKSHTTCDITIEKSILRFLHTIIEYVLFFILCIMVYIY